MLVCNWRRRKGRELIKQLSCGLILEVCAVGRKCHGESLGRNGDVCERERKEGGERATRREGVRERGRERV